MFDGAWLKLARAKQHIEALRKWQDEFFCDRKSFVVAERDNGDGVTKSLFIRVNTPVPIDIALGIGDAVHNLRSALDLLACDIARGAGLPTREVYFPFCEIAADLDDMIKRRHLDKAPAGADMIIKALEPYKGGALGLWELHRLDIEDKHKLLIPVVSAAVAATLDIDFTKGTTYMRKVENYIFATVTDGLVIDPSAPKEFEPHPMHAIFCLAFGPDMPFSGDDVLPTLDKLADSIQRAIQSFEQHLTRSNQGP